MLVIGAVVLIVLLAPTRPEPPSRCLSPPPLRVEIGAVTPGSYQPTVRVLERQIEPGTRVAPEDYDDALQAAALQVPGGRDGGVDLFRMILVDEEGDIDSRNAYIGSDETAAQQWLLQCNLPYLGDACRCQGRVAGQ